MPAAAAASRSSSPGDVSVGASSQSVSSAKRRSPLAVGEVVDLEPLDLRLDVGLARQQRRHHDQRPQRPRHAVVEVEPRQAAGARAGWSRTGSRARSRGRTRDRARGAPTTSSAVPARRRPRTAPAARRGGAPSTSAIAREVGAASPRARRHAGRRDRQRQRGRRGSCSNARPAVRDQVVAGIPARRRAARPPSRGDRGVAAASAAAVGGAAASASRGLPGDLDLGRARTAGQLLDRVAVAVAGREVHRRERPSRRAGPRRPG